MTLPRRLSNPSSRGLAACLALALVSPAVPAYALRAGLEGIQDEIEKEVTEVGGVSPSASRAGLEAQAEQVAQVEAARRAAEEALTDAAKQVMAEGAAPQLVLVSGQAMVATLADGRSVAPLIVLLREVLPDRVFVVPDQWGSFKEIKGLEPAIERIRQSAMTTIPVAIYVENFSVDTTRLEETLPVAFAPVQVQTTVVSVANQDVFFTQQLLTDLGLPDPEGRLKVALDAYLKAAAGLEQAELYL